ncbi:MAG TPA: hypothetical protein VIH19_02865 [Candidatus Limnocylindria bacterium]|jgi:hypothetical protein
MRRSVAGTFALLIATTTAAACSAPGATAEPTRTSVASGAASPSDTPSWGTPSALPTLPAVPDQLPVMPEAVPADPPPTEREVIAGWTVDAVGPEVYAFYLDALPAAGFVVTERFPGGNVAVIRFTTPDGDTLDLALVGEAAGERTRISLRLPEGP